MALETLDCFADTATLSPFAPRILHPLIRLFESHPDDTVCTPAVALLCTLVLQMGPEHLVFRTAVDAALSRGRIAASHRNRYDKMVVKLLKVRYNSSHKESIAFTMNGGHNNCAHNEMVTLGW